MHLTPLQYAISVCYLSPVNVLFKSMRVLNLNSTLVHPVVHTRVSLFSGSRFLQLGPISSPYHIQKITFLILDTAAIHKWWYFLHPYVSDIVVKLCCSSYKCAVDVLDGLNQGALILANLEPKQHTPQSKFYTQKLHWFHSWLKPKQIEIEFIEIA